MALVRRVKGRLAGEDGVSLTELVIAMGLLGLIGAIIMMSLSTSARAGAQIDDQTRGLADLQVVTERLSRDLRAARGVDEHATEKQLTLWIDSDSDYRREPDESITWRIRAGATAGQFDVERIVGPLDASVPDVQIEGRSLVSDIAFSYLRAGATASPELADSVRVAMEYDAFVGVYATSKTVSFDVRLRNAP